MPLSRFASQYPATSFAYGTAYAPALQVVSGPNASGAGSLTLGFGYFITTDGIQVNAPLNTNAPINVGIGSSIETVTPSGVSNSTPQQFGTSTVTATFGQAHGNGDQVRSGTYGLQEAINYANSQGGGQVLVDAAWTQLGGTSAVLNAAVLPANGTVSILDIRSGNSAISTVTVPITNAQVLAMFTTPIQLVAAPGAGNMINVIDMTVENVFLTAAFAAGGAIQASYGAGVTTPATATIATTFLTAPAANQVIKVAGALASALSSAVLNTAVNLTCATANFTTGGGSLIVKLRYAVQTGF
jgi:hypothetical protein